MLDVPHDDDLGYPGHPDAMADRHTIADGDADLDPGLHADVYTRTDRYLAGRAHPDIDAGSKHRGAVTYPPRPFPAGKGG